MTSWTEIMTLSPFFQKILILRRPGVAIFADIIKIVITFIKTILKYSRKVRKSRSYVSKWNLYLYFLTQQNFLLFGKKLLMSAESKGFFTWFIQVLDLLQVRYNCAKFHHCRICVTDFREGGSFCPPSLPSMSSPEKAHPESG